MLIFETRYFKINKDYNNYNIIFKKDNLTLNLQMYELVNLSILCYFIFNEKKIYRSYLVEDITDVLIDNDYFTIYSKSLSTKLDIKVAYQIYYVMKLIIESIGLINLVDPNRKNSVYNKVISSEYDTLSSEEMIEIQNFINDADLKTIAEKVLLDGEEYSYNIDWLKDSNDINSIRNRLEEIYKTYNKEFEQYVEYVNLYVKYRTLKLFKSGINHKYIYVKKIKEDELQKLYKEETLESTINVLKQELMMVYNTSSNTTSDIKSKILDDYKKEINLSKDMLHSQKEINIYSDNDISISFINNKVNLFITTDLTIKLSSDEYIELLKTISNVLKTNEKSTLLTESCIIELDVNSDNLITISFIGSSYRYSYNITKVKLESVLVILEKSEKFLPLYFSLTNKTAKIVKENNSKVIVFSPNSDEEELVEIDNNKVSIELWNPYTDEEINSYTPTITDEECIKDLMGLANLLTVLDEEKLNSMTLDLIKKYMNLIPNYSIKYISLDNVRRYKNKLKTFLEDPKNIAKTIDLRRLIKKYKNDEIVKHIYMNYTLKERSYNRYLSLLSIYLIVMILEDEELETINRGNL